MQYPQKLQLEMLFGILSFQFASHDHFQLKIYTFIRWRFECFKQVVLLTDFDPLFKFALHTFEIIECSTIFN